MQLCSVVANTEQYSRFLCDGQIYFYLRFISIFCFSPPLYPRYVLKRSFFYILGEKKQTQQRHENAVSVLVGRGFLRSVYMYDRLCVIVSEPLL